jgi:hypothetical protein
MELESKIIRAKELIAQRDAINAELEQLLSGTVKKALRCGTCGRDGHTARSCTERPTG